MKARSVVGYGAYPAIMALVITAVSATPTQGTRLAWLALCAVGGLLLVAWLERFVPFDARWQKRDLDFPADVAHAVVNLAVMHGAVLGFVGLREWTGWPGLWWPAEWPYLLQVFLASAPLDLSLYAVHRLSHHNGFLWRLHSIHHSSRRLYWLNGERRHPVHATLMAGPGLLVLGILGAPAAVVGGWFAILAVHLAFQHANLDYRLGPVRYLLGVAELHRWHHRERFADAQVNFGEFWLVWDHLFGTFYQPQAPLGPIGIEGNPVPHRYGKQLVYPFERSDPQGRLGSQGPSQARDADV
ncbi:MAG: sterol desaturase [Cupriavidus sp.]|uniref:sterol desaturase family protein n=1 Tax=Cupriavidus pauculus TaxID=82633 RepID=UPI000C553DC7|nr:sterol desaturase family protein [Cupriavidus pauculus]KAB0596406.1 sterol desaturase family protein [Cupriavidus pauculus]MBU68007.1 sterol desaturase [Cupriavidus sp.]MBY4733398.1 sterol desaturase family protein [Cupriavidus pauculus]UAL03856.1 sterol desaturase family protein [Cupriavidus pauculus]